MRNQLIEGVEQAHLRRTPLTFDIGDTVTVRVRIREGGKERIQPFEGVVIARRGAGINTMFTVRRIVNDEGVERVFPLHSPFIVGVDVKRSGKTRRAKLFFLRQRVGKARKLRERRGGAAEKAAAAEEAVVTAAQAKAARQQQLAGV